jgi:hypothetical protein
VNESEWRSDIFEQVYIVSRHVYWDQEKLFNEKIPEEKISSTVPLKQLFSISMYITCTYYSIKLLEGVYAVSHTADIKIKHLMCTKRRFAVILYSRHSPHLYQLSYTQHCTYMNTEGYRFNSFRRRNTKRFI